MNTEITFKTVTRMGDQEIENQATIAIPQAQETRERIKELLEILKEATKP